MMQAIELIKLLNFTKLEVSVKLKIAKNVKTDMVIKVIRLTSLFINTSRYIKTNSKHSTTANMFSIKWLGLCKYLAQKVAIISFKVDKTMYTNISFNSNVKFSLLIIAIIRGKKTPKDDTYASISGKVIL